MYRLILQLMASLVLLGALLSAARAEAQLQPHLPVAIALPHEVAELPVVAPDSSIGAALRNLAARAGLVFVGQVSSVQRKGGVVEITFTVQQAVQGSTGGTYTLCEWAGLWAEGASRYTPGQRAMVFLLPENAAGLSSPVDGMDGIVPLVPMGADAAPLLDVRRLATRVQRSVGQRMEAEAVELPEAVAAIAQPARLVEPAKRMLPVGWKPAVPMPGLETRFYAAH